MNHDDEKLISEASPDPRPTFNYNFEPISPLAHADFSSSHVNYETLYH
jgi:hypothetical protein